jgi:hypothetical protein
MGKRPVLFLVAFMILAASFGASAQTLGTVAGVARDASGAVLPGVTVEAASPALIEKVRTGVTDDSGQYRIVNLPPGTYAVTFTLQGFSTVRREDVAVNANFTATINADMKVGTVEETITVTGESPVVDIQSAALTRTVTAENFKEIPSSGSWVQMASLVPAIRASIQDVGGILGDQTGAQVSAHGSREGDGVSMVDGLRIGNMYLSSNLTNMSLSPLLFEQVDVQLSGQIAETGTNGVIMNAIPKIGGNRYSGSALINGSWPDLQGSNVTDRLNARGLQNASTTLKKLYDINGSLGGPIRQDRLWFFATSRYFTNEYYLASRFYPTDAAAVRRTEDRDRQAYGGTYTYDNNGRVTWQINDKQKLSGFYAYQYKVDPHWLIQVFTASPEAARVTTWHTQLSTTKWTYTATNRLLFEAGVAAGASPDTIKTDLSRVGGISITDQSTNLIYRAPTGFDFDDRLPSQSFNVSTSYVTGSHSAKIGVEIQRGHFWRGDNNESTGGIWYFINNQAAAQPTQVTIQAPVAGWQNNLNYNLGLFAQDRWTVDRFTLSGGIRLDMLNESTEPVTAAPHRWLPNRTTTFAAVENVPNWKDINPRVAVAYDLFGNGKTALKASASRGVEQDSIRYALASNPANTVQTSANRSWNDSTFGVGDPRTGNFEPDCDLRVGTANGECGAWVGPSLNFGNPNPATVYDRAIMEGWGVRPWNWEFSTGVQHELLPRMSVAFGYFRRVNGNFYVQDNEALGPDDFTEFSVTRPSTDARLPGAGQPLGGFFDPRVNVAARNVIKDASQFGTWQQHWNGVDLTVDARLQNGLYLQGGVSTGKTMTDVCEIVDDVPELLQVAGAAPTGVQPLVSSPGPNVWTSKQFCHQETGNLPQYKGVASYTLPWYGVRVAGTFQSVPGPMIASNAIYSETSATLPRATMTTLGRPITGLGQTTLNLIEPGTLYGDRLNQVDLRFTKIVSVGRGRIDVNVDLYNAFNSDAILGQLNNFGPAWQLPLTVIQPRFVKFSARWDF